MKTQTIRKVTLRHAPYLCDACEADLKIGQLVVQIGDVFRCVRCARRLRDGLVRALGPDTTVN